MLACGAFVISEPLTPNEYLRPNLDYIEVSSKENLFEVVSFFLITRKNERKFLIVD